MRNLKKILALVLALMMTVSLMVVASAANIDNYDDKEEISDKYAVAVEVLSGIGIYQGDGAGEDTFRPQDSLSRAEVAVLLYRLLTTDVDDSEVDELPTTQLFDDVPSDEWFTGYINYAFTNAWVQGNGDGTYSPEAAITGYELTTMLVRALGRDNNFNEIGGDDWTTDAAVLGERTGIFEGLGSEVVLSNAVTREQAAQMIFNALNAYTWDETEWSGHYDVNTTTMGEEKLGLTHAPTGYYDSWGRPAEIWYADSEKGTGYDSDDGDKLYAAFEIEALYTDNKPITECDLSTELGLNKQVSGIEVFINGVYTDDDETITPTNLRSTMDSAQGRQMEVYDADSNGVVDTIVYIDTYLAQVTEVNEATSDPAGHPETPAYSELNVWMNGPAGNQPTATDLLMSGIDYAKGSYILVNVNEGDAHFFQLTDEDDFVVYPVQEAEAFVGAQTAYTTKASHIVEDKEYPDAVNFYLDEAGNEVIDHTWYFDQFGNLIGATDIDDVYSFGTISEIVWVDSNGLENGYALAKLTYMDGTDAEMKIAEINGKELVGVEGKGANYANGLVSSTKQYNESTNAATADYTNVALYKITSGKNGLELTEMTKLYGSASITTGVPEMEATRGFYATNDTLFLVWNGKGYETYTGINEVPSYKPSGTDRLFWAAEVAVGSDLAAEYVFINNAALTTETTQNTFYANSDDTLTVTSHVDGNIRYYEIEGGYVNGKPATVTINGGNETDYTKNTTVMAFLNNQGLLLAFDQTDGVVDDSSVRVITTAEDATDNKEFAVNAGLVADANLQGDVLYAGGVPYNVSSATVLSYDGKDLEKHIKEETGSLYVIYTTDDGKVNGTSKTALYVIITDTGIVKVSKNDNVTSPWSNTYTSDAVSEVLAVGDKLEITLKTSGAGKFTDGVDHELTLTNGMSAVATGDGSQTITFEFPVTFSMLNKTLVIDELGTPAAD